MGTAPVRRGAPEVRRNSVVALAGGGFLVALLAVAAPLQGPPPHGRPEPAPSDTRVVDEPSPSPDRPGAPVDAPAAEAAAPVRDGREAVVDLTAVSRAPEPSATPAAEAVAEPSPPATADPTEHPSSTPTPTPSGGHTEPRGPEERPTHAATRPASPPRSSRSPQESRESPESRESRESMTSRPEPTGTGVRSHR